MDKDTIVAEARRLTDAAEQAQQWIARNEERVRSCGKSREDVLAKLKASEGKPQAKSKWQQRLEAAQKMQQQMIKEQNKKARR